MREIKFRAWLKNAKTMEYPEKQWNLFMWAEDENQPIDIMQYTGLKDKNGKEIYEKDVIGSGDKRVLVDFRGGCFIVVYAPENRKEIEGECLTDNLDTFMKCFRVEILGNIYESPELLKDTE